MARPYFWKYVEDKPAVPGMPGVSGAQFLMFMAGGWNEELKTPQWNDLYNQVSSGKEYDKNLYEQLVAPHTYDIWATNPYGKKQLSEWHQADLAEQKRKQEEALAKQRAEQERLRAEQEARAREQQAALEKQRQAAEKARKDAEFKSALDAMNQRAMPRKEAEEFIGEIDETPEQAAQRKKKKVGYDATKVTGILGAAPTESKKLLGM